MGRNKSGEKNKKSGTVHMAKGKRKLWHKKKNKKNNKQEQEFPVP
jgi:hypothetical protein